MRLKMLSFKSRPFCLDLNVLRVKYHGAVPLFMVVVGCWPRKLDHKTASCDCLELPETADYRNFPSSHIIECQYYTPHHDHDVFTMTNYQFSAKVYNHYDVYNHDYVINDNEYDDASNNNDNHWTVQQC